MRDGIVFDLDGPTVTQAIMAALARRNFAVVRSFDLRSALAARHDCPCPVHGTAGCRCEFAVLLAYGDAPEPVVVTAHCRDGQTDVRLVRDAATVPDPRLAEQVMDVLVEVGLALHFVPAPRAVNSDA